MTSCFHSMRHRCSRREEHRDDRCWRQVLGPKYLFYLSFENALCDAYVTEKLWRPLMHGLVPVVLGGANYTAILPPNSYINAVNLTPRQLSHILRRLQKFPRAYADYHLWRAFWRPTLRPPLCELCLRLHSKSRTTTQQNIKGWWRAVGQCRPPDWPWAWIQSLLFLAPMRSARALRLQWGAAEISWLLHESMLKTSFSPDLLFLFITFDRRQTVLTDRLSGTSSFHSYCQIGPQWRFFFLFDNEYFPCHHLWGLAPRSHLAFHDRSVLRMYNFPLLTCLSIFIIEFSFTGDRDVNFHNAGISLQYEG